MTAATAFTIGVNQFNGQPTNGDLISQAVFELRWAAYDIGWMIQDVESPDGYQLLVDARNRLVAAATDLAEVGRA